MALDFTVVMPVRQRFGEEKPDKEVADVGLETDAPFVGQQKDYSFRCPNVDTSQFAILLFQSQGVVQQQRMTINGQIIYGGIPPSVDRGSDSLGTFLAATWKGNVMLVTPGVLAENNVLHIESRKVAGILDSFIVDNVVVIFKSRDGVIPRLARE